MITKDHFVQIKGSNFASGVQNTSEDGDLNIFQYFGVGVVIYRRAAEEMDQRTCSDTMIN